MGAIPWFAPIRYRGRRNGCVSSSGYLVDASRIEKQREKLLMSRFISRRRHVVILMLAAAFLSGMIGHAFAAESNAKEAPAKSASGMFLSMRDGYIGADTFPTLVDGLRHLHIDAVELNLGRDFGVQSLDSKEKIFLKTDDDAKQYRQKAEKLGVNICSVLTACDFSAGDMESNVAWIARAIELADLLGASSVRIDSAMAKEKQLDFETRVKIFVEGLSGALQRTSGSKVTLGIENHGFQGNNLAFLLNTFQQVGSDRLGSTLDVGNFYWRGYPLSEVYGILNILAPHAKHTHMKNIHYPEDKREITREAGWEYGKYCCPLDEGDIDLTKVIAMLAKVGYKGDVCIEDESVGKCKTPEERIAVLERDIAHLRKILDGMK
jgi:sugar phosphate isomerase/epimerase